MEVGHLLRFHSQPFPFLVEAMPCVEGDDAGSTVFLSFTEFSPTAEPRDRLNFTMQVRLPEWLEIYPPPRSLEVESLAREFMARFPDQRIAELHAQCEQACERKRQLDSFEPADSPDALVTYGEAVGSSVREGSTNEALFFVFEGREFFVEDHYCVNPACDCQQVHVEFWERVHILLPERRFRIVQRLKATFTLAGKLVEVDFSEEDAETTKYLLRAWRRRCDEQLQEFAGRYELMKSIGARRFPRERPSRAATIRLDATPYLETSQLSHGSAEPLKNAPVRVRRNAPCPCGSGLKFKRCCARRVVADE